MMCKVSDLLRFCLAAALLLPYGADSDLTPNRRHQKLTVTVLAGSPAPGFKAPVNQVVATEGQDASFICKVTHLGKHQVVWIKFDTEQVLTYHLHVIIADQRFQIQTRGDEYLLNIRNVTRADRGLYMCQINTDPPAVSYGELDIVKAPVFLENDTSMSDVIVNEHATATLRCSATGNPSPNITWQRADGRMLPGNKSLYIQRGKDLTIPAASRHDMGIYVCMASNGVIPSVRRNILLKVKFPPVVRIGSNRKGAVQGSSVALQCTAHCYPLPVIDWYFGNEHINVNERRRQISYQIRDEVEMTSTLSISSVDKSDFGKYVCKVYNVMSAAKKEESISLYEVKAPTPARDATAGITGDKKFSKHHRRKDPSKGSLSLAAEDDPSVQSHTSAQSPSKKVFSSDSPASSATQKIVFQGSWFRLFVTLLIILIP